MERKIAMSKTFNPRPAAGSDAKSVTKTFSGASSVSETKSTVTAPANTSAAITENDVTGVDAFK